MNGVLYDFADGLYLNITNRCPCRCEFCIRNFTDHLGGTDSLWLDREPTVEEVIALLQAEDLSPYSEAVFCGYGEPTERLDTNGLSDLIHGRDTAADFEGVVDSVSVSLNQCTAEKYAALCHPVYGEAAFPALLAFTKNIRAHVPDVRMSVVGVIPAEDEEACRRIAEDLGVFFRVR